jgi:hypothetical protein
MVEAEMGPELISYINSIHTTVVRVNWRPNSAVLSSIHYQRRVEQFWR